MNIMLPLDVLMHVATVRRYLSLRSFKIVVASLHLQQCSIGGCPRHVLQLPSGTPTFTASSQHMPTTQPIGMHHLPILFSLLPQTSRQPSPSLSRLHNTPMYTKFNLNESFSDFICSYIHCMAPGKITGKTAHQKFFMIGSYESDVFTALVALIQNSELDILERPATTCWHVLHFYLATGCLSVIQSSVEHDDADLTC